ncbi:hypothetical protein TNCT_613801 [Trichonephila clavata]|uniref:Uncharacterized protein n=1 Tax=Trichonephila clavata TaxID=2740835 RepID=A0A8X6F0A5_TRICU|nr:hypothetical protein TNCT_613801 [Trichonephila clavata]
MINKQNIPDTLAINEFHFSAHLDGKLKLFYEASSIWRSNQNQFNAETLQKEQLETQIIQFFLRQNPVVIEFAFTLVKILAFTCW